MILLAFAALFGVVVMSMPASAQAVTLDQLLPNQSPSTAGRVIQALLVLTVLSVAPGLLMMVTCFTRFVIAFSFLRAGLGLPTTPGNLVLINLALFMTWFVMAPTFEQAWRSGLSPLLEDKLTVTEAVDKIAEPFKGFMKENVRPGDVERFLQLAEDRLGPGQSGQADDLRILVPAFMISELRRGFEIGFLIALPFLVIDLVVATIVMSMGMMMVTPTMFSLPLKVLFFVLIDGWSILVSSLIRSFA